MRNGLQIGWMAEIVHCSAAAWATLQRELDRWADADVSATFWWRDDDAITDTPQLHKLDALSRELDVPVALAIIPINLQPSLPRYLYSRHHISVLQHGYAHVSYAPAGVKKIEIGGERDAESIGDELQRGYRTLSAAFDSRFLPVLVPPWNRIESHLYPTVQAAGFVGISSMWARAVAYPAPGLLQVNAHLDPVDWRRDGGFIGEYRALSQICRHLYARRSGRRDRDEPTGILTHHLVQDDAVWSFCRTFMRVLNEHPAVHWLDARAIWNTE